MLILVGTSTSVKIVSGIVSVELSIIEVESSVAISSIKVSVVDMPISSLVSLIDDLDVFKSKSFIMYILSSTMLFELLLGDNINAPKIIHTIKIDDIKIL